jgi:hypothetical protein
MELCTLARGCDCPSAHVLTEYRQEVRELVEGTAWDAEAAYVVSYVAAEIESMFRNPERYGDRMPSVRWAVERLWALAYEKGQADATK